jgi:hypothetical protein
VKDKEPQPTDLVPGQLAINSNIDNPFLAILASDGTVIRAAASSKFMYL